MAELCAGCRRRADYSFGVAPSSWPFGVGADWKSARLESAAILEVCEKPRPVSSKGKNNR